MKPHTLWVAPVADIPLRARVSISHLSPENISPTPSVHTPTVEDASLFLAAAAVTTGTIVIQNWNDISDSSTAVVLREALATMGTYVVRSTEGLTCTSRSTSGHLEGVSVNLSQAQGLLPALTVLAAMADSPSQFTGITEEHEQIVHLLRENLQRLGGLTEYANNTLTVYPEELHTGRWHGGETPHVALAGAVIGLRIPGITIDGITADDESMQDFSTTWHRVMTADEHILPGVSAGTVPFYH